MEYSSLRICINNTRQRMRHMVNFSDPQCPSSNFSYKYHHFPAGSFNYSIQHPLPIVSLVIF